MLTKQAAPGCCSKTSKLNFSNFSAMATNSSCFAMDTKNPTVLRWQRSTPQYKEA